jgi:hypothetical protein
VHLQQGGIRVRLDEKSLDATLAQRLDVCRHHSPVARFDGRGVRREHAEPFGMHVREDAAELPLTDHQFRDAAPGQRALRDSRGSQCARHIADGESSAAKPDTREIE